MSALSDASLIITPTLVGSGYIYAVKPTDGTGDLTFTRASVATRVNSDGYTESVATDIPRINYPIGGGCPHILVEPQRTNLFTYSNGFSNAIWGKTRASITTDTTTGPDGAIAEKLTEDNTASSTHLLSRLNITVASATVYTFSMKVKAGGRDSGLLIFADSTSTSYVTLTFNLSTLVTSDNSVGGATLVSSRIEEAENGFYKIWVTGSLNGAYVLGGGRLFLTSGGTSTYDGDGVSGMYIADAQLEAGSFPTSTIPTTTATVTRIKDGFSKSNLFTDNFISGSGGAWFIELTNNVAFIRDGGVTGLFLADDSSTTNGFRIRNTSSASALIKVEVYVAGVVINTYTTTTTDVKILLNWNGVIVDLWVNGAKVVSALAFTTTVLELLTLNGGDRPRAIKQLALFSLPLSDTICGDLTTY